jgi:hypothetical protein
MLKFKYNLLISRVKFNVMISTFKIIEYKHFLFVMIFTPSYKWNHINTVF